MSEYALEVVKEWLEHHRSVLEARNQQDPRLTASTVRAALRRAVAGLEPLLELNRVDSTTYRQIGDRVRVLCDELRTIEQELPKKFDSPQTEMLRYTVPRLKKIYEQYSTLPKDTKKLREFLCASLDAAKLPRPNFEEYPRKLTQLLRLPKTQFTNIPMSGGVPVAIARWRLLKD
jgi:hypothetical protein